MITNQIFQKIDKEQFLLLAIAGIIILFLCSDMLHPNQKNEKATDFKTSVSKQKMEDQNMQKEVNHNMGYEAELESKLAHLIAQIDGAGKTIVMITTKTSERKVVEKDRPYSRENDNTVRNDETSQNTRVEDKETSVIEEREDGSKVPFVSMSYNPEIAGVVIACEGGNDLEIRKQITEVCQSLFDLDEHTIKVVKIKE